MPEFSPPHGLNFSSQDEVPVMDLCASLKAVASYFQDFDSSRQVNRYDDWWEHDGLHFFKIQSSLHELFEIVKSPESLLTSMPGDYAVRIGFAPSDGIWYLRFYVAWDDTGESLIGNFDLTLPHDRVETFRLNTKSKIPCILSEEESDSYFKKIIV